MRPLSHAFDRFRAYVAAIGQPCLGSAPWTIPRATAPRKTGKDSALIPPDG